MLMLLCRSSHKGILTMCVVILISLTGNLALCGAISNLRADKWRTQVKRKSCYRISIHYGSHVPSVSRIRIKVCLFFYTLIQSSSDTSDNVVLFLLCKYENLIPV
jgi:hypothetical protein